MTDELLLNVPLLRRRVPNLTAAARSAGLRPATVSDLCTGKIPVARAEIRTLAALADLAGCSLDELVLRAGRGGMIETGIKALDLLAPLVRGGVAGLVARQGVGQLVLLAELLRTLRTQRGFATVLWLPDQVTPLLDEVLADPGATATSPDELRAVVAELGAEQDVFVVADRGRVLSGELQQVREQLHEAGTRPVTFALYDPSGETPDEEGAPYGALDTAWHLDLDLAARELYPAIDPVASTSTLLEGAQLEAAHLGLAQRARRLLRRYREWRGLVAIRGVEQLPAEEQTTYRRGERLEAFMTQPFFVAEPFTKRPGAWVPLRETLSSVRRILEGAADDMEVTALKYFGALPKYVVVICFDAIVIS